MTTPPGQPYASRPENLTPQQGQRYAETEAATAYRRPAPAYVLCALLGTLGIHRFYLHRNGSGLAMLLITVLTLGLGAAVTLIWAIVDLFLIGGIVRSENTKIRTQAYARYGLVIPPPAP